VPGRVLGFESVPMVKLKALRSQLVFSLKNLTNLTEFHFPGILMHYERPFLSVLNNLIDWGGSRRQGF